MKPKHKIIKQLFLREKSGNRVGKKTHKPWILQFRWNSLDSWTQSIWYRMFSSSEFNSDWQDHYDKYMDLDHAKQMLEKEQRSWFNDKWEGRSLRLLNKDSGESLNVHLEDKKVSFYY